MVAIKSSTAEPISSAAEPWCVMSAFAIKHSWWHHSVSVESSKYDDVCRRSALFSLLKFHVARSAGLAA